MRLNLALAKQLYQFSWHSLSKAVPASATYKVIISVYIIQALIDL